MNDLTSPTPNNTVAKADDFGWAGLWIGSATGWLALLALLALVQGTSIPNAHSPTWLTVGWVVGHILAIAGALAVQQKNGPHQNRHDCQRTFFLGTILGIALGAAGLGAMMAWVWFSPLIPSPLLSIPVPLGP